ncbi:MurR/RpiR family transcriptional regulator [Streptomyces sp. NPDC059874]|uniref:MurR/RpiR family transcriptional regulator n=1 Tax=Streptomyces sp. NPDC059874 TaxID=3346983 RepID=UPI00365A33E4
MWKSNISDPTPAPRPPALRRNRVDRPTAQALIVQLRGRLPSLSPAERAIADLVLADPAGAATLSISRLASAAGVSDTSVTRFCRALGLSGYPDLRLVLAAAQLAGGEDFAVRIGAGDDIADEDDTATVVAKVARLDARAAQDTAEQLDLRVLDELVDRIAAARRIEIYAAGSGAVVAADLEYKLQHLGLAATARSDVHRALMGAAHLSTGDVAIGISYSGRTGEVIDPLAEAARRGATTAALTSDPLSPLGKTAEHLLTFAGRETTFRTGATVSRIAQLVVVDCLYVRLAQRQDLAAGRALHRAHEAVQGRPRRPSHD